jgi:hypothetical protein
MNTGSTVAIALALTLITAPASAKPPVGANPLYAPFFKSLKQRNGASCCSEADCRPTASRSPNQSPSGHWEAWIDKATFGKTAPNAWVQIPDSLVNDTQTTDPRPEDAIVCWYEYADSAAAGYAFGLGGLLCFRTPATQM